MTKDLNNIYNRYLIDSESSLKHLDLLKQTISLCLYSGYLRERKKLSLLIVAPVGTGKSMTLKLFKGNQNTYTINQTTRYGLANDVLPLFQAASKTGTSLNHIIIPAFETILEGQHGSVSYLVNFLSALIEEGIYKIKTYNLDYDFDPPAQCGLLTATTDTFLMEKKLSFVRDIGFLSRFIIFSYKYGPETEKDVMDEIKYGRNIHYDNIDIHPPAFNTEVVCDGKFVDLFDWTASYQKRSGISAPSRVYEHIRILLKSSALAASRKEVNNDDVSLVMKIAQHMNLDMLQMEPDKIEFS